MIGAPFEQARFVIQRGPDSPVESCRCGSPFAVVVFRDTLATLRCACGEPLDTSIVRFYDIDPKERRSPGHPPCPCMRRVVVPKVRDEVSAEHVRDRGAERWDLFCVDCGAKDGSVTKDTLRGYRTIRRRDDKNDFQRVEVLARAGKRCELCLQTGVALDVGHCLSDVDAKTLGVGERHLRVALEQMRALHELQRHRWRLRPPQHAP